jgi:PAS domain S-box-containing protein
VSHLPERDLRLAREIATLRARIVELEQSLAQKAQLEKQIQVSEELYRRLLESAHDAIVLLDAQTGDIVHANPAFERLTGRSLEVLRTFRLWEIAPAAFRESVKVTSDELLVTSDKGQVTRHSSLVTRHFAVCPIADPQSPIGLPFDTFQLPLERLDGEVIWTEARTTRFSLHGTEYILSICRNISERKQAEENFARHHEFLEKVTSSVPVGLAVIDRDYRLVWVNKTYCDWFANAECEIINPEAESLPRCYEAYERRNTICPDCPAQETFQTAKTAHIERAGLTTTLGPERTLLITTTPLRDLEGGVIQVVELIQDITDYGLRMVDSTVLTHPSQIRDLDGDGSGLALGHPAHETILVIDNDALVRDVTTRMLQRLGYHVLAAEVGEEAVQVASSYPERIHVAMVDIGLSSMGSEEILRRLQEIRPDMAIVLCSGYVLDARTQTLVDTGVVRFIQKPFRLDTLAGVVDSSRAGMGYH